MKKGIFTLLVLVNVFAISQFLVAQVAAKRIRATSSVLWRSMGGPLDESVTSADTPRPETLSEVRSYFGRLTEKRCRVSDQNVRDSALAARTALLSVALTASVSLALAFMVAKNTRPRKEEPPTTA